MPTITHTLLDADTCEEDVEFPARWAICSHCSGEGVSSAYLGAFTGEDMQEDPDFAEAYMRGEYDRACDACSGRGSVLEVDRERADPVQLARLDAEERELAYVRQLEANERRWGA